jgi:hypothetical protein
VCSEIAARTLDRFSMWVLVPHHDAEPVRVVDTVKEITIGSGAGADVRLVHDAYLSRVHFHLRFEEPNRILVTNKSDKNAAFLNGLELPFGEATLALPDADNARCAGQSICSTFFYGGHPRSL